MTSSRKSFMFIAAMAFASSKTAGAMLLSDLPTPSFVVDMQALRRVVGPPINADKPAEDSSTEIIPSILLPKSGTLLRPLIVDDRSPSLIGDHTVDVDFPVVEGQPAIGYLHSSVVRAREEVILGVDDPVSTFLAEIDLEPTLCCSRDKEEIDGKSTMPAKLVLGLNNHHVGSYYWARSAGAGSSMEAPGIFFGDFQSCDNDSHRGGVLRWLDEGGPTVCNSNDGKRSEWVNFLRRGDTVQLVPLDGQDSILQFIKRFGGVNNQSEPGDAKSIRVFGISSKGRPMGSEPGVVCEWRC